MNKHGYKERNIEIFKRVICGETLKQAGEHYGITLERVRQIVYKLSRETLKKHGAEPIGYSAGLGAIRDKRDYFLDKLG